MGRPVPQGLRALLHAVAVAACAVAGCHCLLAPDHYGAKMGVAFAEVTGRSEFRIVGGLYVFNAAFGLVART